MNVETRTVWVDSLDCCGEPFALGSTVTWELHSVDEGERWFLQSVFGEDIAERITDGYERHAQVGPRRVVEGVVRAIEAVSWQIHPLAEAPDSDALGHYALPGSLVIEARTSASRFDRVGGRHCHGYIVDIDVTIATTRKPVSRAMRSSPYVAAPVRAIRRCRSKSSQSAIVSGL